MKHFLLALVAVLAATVTVRAEELTADEIARAQKLFTTGCQNCHRRHNDVINPKAFDDRKWNQWVIKMTPLAKLSREDANLLTVYLSAVRNGKAELPKSEAAPAKDTKPASCGKK